jgi:hypothetical protein
MTSKKICFSTWCTDDYRDRAGVEKLQNSIKYFHPDIPLYIYNSEDTNRAVNKYSDFPNLTKNCMIPVQPIEKNLYEKFDIIIHVDADSTITGSLDVVFEGDYDVAIVRNNSDGGTAGCHPAIHPSDIAWYDFANAGLLLWQTLHFGWIGLIAINNMLINTVVVSKMS